MPFVRTDLSTGPSDVQYLKTGSGPGVVLVHGTGATPEANYAGLIDELKSRHTVVTPYLSGSGGTTDSGGPLTTEDLARQVLAAADDAGLGSFHLAGHSLGACVAAAAAALAGDRVHSLLLHAGWARTDARLSLQFGLWEELLEISPRLLARLILLTAYDADSRRSPDATSLDTEVSAFAELFGAGEMKRQLRVDHGVDIEDLLPRISAPSLVVSGTSDTVIPPQHQERMAELIPHAQLVRVAGGHAYPFEFPKKFITLVTEFIDNWNADGPALQP